MPDKLTKARREPHADDAQGLTLVRTTPEFDEHTMPAALRRAHRVAEGVWGRVCAREGTLVFRMGTYQRVLHAGDTHDIAPATDHDVTPQGHVRFVVEFWR